MKCRTMSHNGTSTPPSDRFKHWRPRPSVAQPTRAVKFFSQFTRLAETDTREITLTKPEINFRFFKSLQGLSVLWAVYPTSVRGCLEKACRFVDAGNSGLPARPGRERRALSRMLHFVRSIDSAFFGRHLYILGPNGWTEGEHDRAQLLSPRLQRKDGGSM